MHKFLLIPAFFLFAAVSFAQLTPQQWQADIAFLKKELPARHPDFFKRITPEMWHTALDGIAAGVEQKSDLRVALELQTAVARAVDAKTRLEFVQLLQTNKVIPIAFGWYADGLYASATVQKFEPALGKKIRTINGLDPETALEKLNIYVGSDNQAGLKRDGPMWLRFPLAFRLAGLSRNDSLALELENPNGETTTVFVYPPDMRKAGRSDMMPAQLSPKNPDLRWQPVSIEELYKYIWMEEQQIFFLQYNICLSREMAEARGDMENTGQLPLFQPVVDSLLQIMRAYPDARFFLDLRFNRGGLPEDGIALAKLLGAEKEINKPGRLFIAINGYTAPAPTRIALAFREFTKAQLIGEPTGERPVYTGEEDKFQLPNSNVFVVHPRTLLAAPKNTKDALYPDVLLPLQFADFREGRDPVLDYVRQLQPGSVK